VLEQPHPLPLLPLPLQPLLLGVPYVLERPHPLPLQLLLQRRRERHWLLQDVPRQLYLDQVLELLLHAEVLRYPPTIVAKVDARHPSSSFGLDPMPPLQWKP
jgi:hypothetical protein